MALEVQLSRMRLDQPVGEGLESTFNLIRKIRTAHDKMTRVGTYYVGLTDAVGSDGVIGGVGSRGVRTGDFDCHAIQLPVGSKVREGCEAICKLEADYKATIYDAVTPPSGVRIHDQIDFMLLFQENDGDDCLCFRMSYTCPPAFLPGPWRPMGQALSYWYRAGWDVCPCGSGRAPATTGPPDPLPPEPPEEPKPPRPPVVTPAPSSPKSPDQILRRHLAERREFRSPEVLPYFGTD